jgi:hypothetical protein
VFEELEDPRTGNAKRHLLLEILLIALCTLLSGGASCGTPSPVGPWHMAHCCAKMDGASAAMALNDNIPASAPGTMKENLLMSIVSRRNPSWLNGVARCARKGAEPPRESIVAMRKNGQA